MKDKTNVQGSAEGAECGFLLDVGPSQDSVLVWVVQRESYLFPLGGTTFLEPSGDPHYTVKYDHSDLGLPSSHIYNY